MGIILVQHNGLNTVYSENKIEINTIKVRVLSVIKTQTTITIKHSLNNQQDITFPTKVYMNKIYKSLKTKLIDAKTHQIQITIISCNIVKYKKYVINR